ncbi:MAG: SecDF P1 head subdomain-containing protein [Kofleriaceae bacterium]
MSEPIPSAIARGPDAETPGSISPLQVGIGAGVLAMVFVLVTFVVRPVPDRALSIVGGDASEFGRVGGMRLVWVPPANVDPAQVERIFLARHHGRVSRSGDAFVVEVGGVPPEEVEYAAHLVSSGGLTFHRAVITEAMPELGTRYGIQFHDIDDPGRAQKVALEIDRWRPEDGGADQTDYYLVGDTREAIEAVLDGARRAGWSLPEGTHVAYERVEPWSNEDQRPYWRSYVIETKAALAGEHIADATASYDPNTNRPIVLLDFDREGTQIFGDLTSSMVGQKLATVLGGTVVSAPIINGPIRGGRASITMGGADAMTQKRERDALVGALRAGQLPVGGTLREAVYIAPSVTVVQEWLARILAALAAGLLVGLVAWALVRKTRPVWRTPEVRVPGSIAWPRLAVLLLAPLAVIGASRITAPGVDVEQILSVVGDVSYVNIGMLGITPLLTSFLLVELAATVVPSWRRRRHAGPTARLPFDVATIVGALVLSIIQGWFAAVHLERLDAGAVGFDRLLFLGGVVGATCAFALVAWIIRVYGAGNGYAALLVTAFVVRVHAALSPSTHDGMATPVSSGDIVLGVVATLGFAIVVGVVLRWRVVSAGQAPLRIPTSGIAPVAELQGLLSFVVIAVGSVSLGAVSFALYDAQIWMLELHRAVGLVAIAVFVLLGSWAFARPRVFAPYADRAKLSPPSWESWRRATLLSVGVLGIVVAGYALHGALDTKSMLGVIPGAVFAAFALDAYDDLRGRRGRLAYVWSLQSAQHADLAGQALERENIAFHLSGTNLRTVFAWFGPFAPIDVWVRREDVQRTRDLLANIFLAK